MAARKLQPSAEAGARPVLRVCMRRGWQAGRTGTRGASCGAGDIGARHSITRVPCPAQATSGIPDAVDTDAADRVKPLTASSR
jgi:hypothetical protein